MIIQNKEILLESWSVAGPQKWATNITFEVPKKMSSRTLQVRGNSLKRRQEYLDISKPKHTFYSLNYTLAITTATMHGVQTWLDEAWLMAEKHSHRSLIRCKKIVCSYPETVKQEKRNSSQAISPKRQKFILQTMNSTEDRWNRRQKCEKHVGKGTTLHMSNSYPRALGQTGTNKPARKWKCNSNNIIWWYITKIATSVL